MVDRAPVRLPEGTRVATIACAAMIAQQVAGKAARDALFLSSFHVRTLPAMMAVSAVVSLVVVLWLARVMVRHAPARVVPVAFALSGAAFLAEWALSFPSPGLAAIALYLHTTLFGAAIISAFWSLINETFAPHSGRGAVWWIAAGGTIGGVLGGLVAWRAAAVIAVPTMLPLLAAVNLVCLWGAVRLRSVRSAAPAIPSEDPEAPVLAPLSVLRGAPYLRGLALVVGLGAVISGLLDYVFSAEAVRAYAKAPDLLAFFALFWLVVGVLSFALQMALGRLALEKLGHARTVALLPGTVLLGGALGLAVPGLFSMAVLRGAEATQRNSLFRSAYELLYTPLAEKTKRSTKTLIDVGLDRLGTVTASAISTVVLYVAPAGGVEPILVVVAMACALVSVLQTPRLHRGYVAVLEEGLRNAAEGLEAVAAAPSLPAQDKIDVRDQVVEHLDELRAEAHAAQAPDDWEVAPPPASALAALVQPVVDLTSGNPDRARRVLGAEAPLATPLVAVAVLLLGDKAVHLDAIRALRRVADKATGQLVDALCDPSLDFDIRRRIPRVLSECLTQHAADGLVRGLDDDRFEVRYACGRALLKMIPDAGITISRDRVIAAVQEEVNRAKTALEVQALEDDEEDEATSLVDRLRRDKIDRGMEHVFNLLALHLDRESLRTAFNALHAEDAQLHGTALEYLETVLPAEVRDLVWPFLGEERPMRAARPAQEILADLVRSREPPSTGE